VIILLYDGFSEFSRIFIVMANKETKKVLKLDRYFLDHKPSEDIIPNNI